MKILALIPIICFLSFTLVAQNNDVSAENPVGFITKSSVIDTGWVDVDPMGNCPETHYPVSIELTPLKGDSVRYRVVFIPKPSESFEHKFIMDKRTPKYRALHSELIKQGYVQICHQVVTVMVGNVHQAVWVRIQKREQDAGDQLPTAEKSKS